MARFASVEPGLRVYAWNGVRLSDYFFAAANCCAAESQLTTFHHALM